MAAKNNFPLSITIKAIDKASGPIKKISATIGETTGPKTLGDKFQGLVKNDHVGRLAASFKAVGPAVSNVGKEAFKLGAALTGMAVGGGFALFSIVHGAMEAGDKLAEMAQRTGFAVDAYASLQFAAAQADISQEDFNGAMDQFNKRLGEAKAGGGGLLEFLKKTGPGLAAQIKGAKSSEQALSFMTDALNRIKDPQRRAALAAAAFGKSGLQMGQFLGQGSEAIQLQQKRFLELSGSQTKFAAGASDLDNAMRETETSFMGLRNAAAAELFPALTELSKAVTEVFAGNRDSVKKWATEAGGAISAWVKDGGVQRLVDGFKALAQHAGELVDKLGGVKGLAIAVGLAMSSGLITSVVQLGAVLVPLTYQIGTLLTKALWSALMAVMEFNFGPMIAGLGSAATATWGFIASLGPLAIAAAPFVLAAAGIAAAGYQIWKNWDKLTFIFKDFWNGLVFDALQAWDKIKPIVDAIAGAFKGGAIGWIASKFSSIGDSAAGALGQTTFDMNAAESAAPQAFSSEPTKVQVSFANAPKGTRVSSQPGDAELDLSVGYSMGAP